MFTGLVERMGVVHEIRNAPPGKRLCIDLGETAERVQIGDSIAINGCCLTVVEINGKRLSFDAGEETLSRTNLGKLTVSDRVNIELSLRVGDSMGGHFVTGHVDAIGWLQERIDDTPWCKMWFRVPQALIRQMASKGSVCVDGVSLTLVDVVNDRFSVALIPHTLQVTTLGRLSTGQPVNIETDILAKYVERQIGGLAMSSLPF